MADHQTSRHETGTEPVNGSRDTRQEQLISKQALKPSPPRRVESTKHQAVPGVKPSKKTRQQKQIFAFMNENNQTYKKISTVRLGSCALSTGAVFSAFGARLPVFPTASFAKIAKLTLSGLEQGNFYAPLAGENNGISRYRAGKQHQLPTLEQRKKHTGHC